MTNTGPLIPRDVDLRCYETMPLNVKKLRESTFAVRSNGDQFMAGVLLWGAAFQQVPAGRLKDDDYELSNHAGYGRAVDVWRKVRQGALHGFVDGGDGYLYHREVCRVAFFDCWMTRLRWLHSAEEDRVRKHNKANPERQLPRPTLMAFVRDNYPDTACYLDVLEELRPPIGWALLQKGQRRGFKLPENLPLPPSRRLIPTENVKLLAETVIERQGCDADTEGITHGFPPEIGLNGTEQERKKELPPAPLAGGGVVDGAGFAEFLAVGGDRWTVLRADRARIAWDERLGDGVEPRLLIASARAYFAMRDDLDRKSQRIGTVVSPTTFLRSHWETYRASGELLMDQSPETGPDWGERGVRLAELIGGLAVFASWFDGATLDDGPPVTIMVPKQFVANWVNNHFRSALERVFGSDVVVMAGAA